MPARASIGRVGEWGLLKRLLPDLARRASSRVRVPPGDDAAVVDLGSQDRRLAITTDMLVEGVHFDTRWTTGEDLGHKALAVNLSDLAAMGQMTPLGGVVSLGLPPRTSMAFVQGFYRGLRNLARAHKFDLLGGDTVRADKIVVSIAALGVAPSDARLIRRDGARPGDLILVTGCLGDAAAGLSLFRRDLQIPPADKKYLKRRLLRPSPRLDIARRLGVKGGLTALMDSSDGLWRSVNLIAEASGMGAVLWGENVPISGSLRRWARAARRDPLDVSLAGGEDYELVMTAPPRAAQLIRPWATIIGQVLPRRAGVKVFSGGKKWKVPHGFEHFG